MPISVAEPVAQAWNRMVKTLFAPFQLEKWMVIGFCAFLAYLGEGGGLQVPFQGPGRGRSGSEGGSGGGGGSGAPPWLHDALPLILVLGAVLLILGIAIVLVVMWIKARGQFMFLDNLDHNRGAVVEPWKRFRRLGNSLFLFQIVLMLLSALLLMIVIGLGFAIAWPDIHASQFGLLAALAILWGLLALIPSILLVIAVTLILSEFAVPLMYLHDLPATAAMGLAWRQIVRPHWPTVLLFFLLRFALQMIAGMIGCFGVCLTCCIAAIPYVGTVILLPLFVFLRCYSLYFVQQFDPQRRFFEDERAAAILPPG